MEGTKNENEERKGTKESCKIGASAVQVYSRSHCRGHTTLRSRWTKKDTISTIEAELRIEESAGSSDSIVRLQGVLVGTAPRVGEKVEFKEGKFKVVEVSHQLSVSPLKHVVVVTIEKHQPTAAQ